MPKISSRQISGQVGIIVILITAAILTFGLSVANRVIRESKVTVDRSDAIRVFNVAETGIDEALNKIYQFEKGLTTIPDSNIATNPLNQVKITKVQSFQGNLTEGEVLRIDINNGTTGTLNLEWSEVLCTSSYKIGLLLTLVDLSGGSYRSQHYLLGRDSDNNCFNSTVQNYLNIASNPSETLKYSYPFNINPALSEASLYIQPIGSNTKIEVSSSTINLIKNAQYEIESLAKSEDDISNKAIQVTRSIPGAPSFMLFALFSGDTIVK